MLVRSPAQLAILNNSPPSVRYDVAKPEIKFMIGMRGRIGAPSPLVNQSVVGRWRHPVTCLLMIFVSRMRNSQTFISDTTSINSGCSEADVGLCHLSTILINIECLLSLPSRGLSTAYWSVINGTHDRKVVASDDVTLQFRSENFTDQDWAHYGVP
ncbi:hypothetical protein CROQUDRAFT_86702 [Cronartium quercuum f. sp. fusiforme G11]|uniref:Uncharacterized protein n=1 Tax=Cronartium quercuum f. sp. fusiforme G11 TaxID=708437 RepID=A0A9P6NSX7_9BASI|nr:hypothetical protein CROQUDRAFT_86702 [Cronartium quercuum f. sp. fusiforme G11]